MVRYLIILLILSSCSSTKLLNRAIKKDPTILHNTTIRDTIQITKVDSIPYIVNDTIRYKLVEKVTDTIVEFKYKYITAPITRQQTRLNSKEGRLLIKQKEETARLVARLNKRNKAIETRLKKAVSRHENRSGTWYWFFIIGLLIGAFVVLYIKR